MFVSQSPITVGFDGQGNKVVIPAGQEVSGEDFPSEKAFNRLFEIGAIKDTDSDVVVKERPPVKSSNLTSADETEIEIVPELWADEDGNIPEGVLPVEKEKSVEDSEPVELTKKECVALLLAAEVNANGENDEVLTEKDLMKNKVAELNQMVRDLEK